MYVDKYTGILIDIGWTMILDMYIGVPVGCATGAGSGHPASGISHPTLMKKYEKINIESFLRVQVSTERWQRGSSRRAADPFDVIARAPQQI